MLLAQVAADGEDLGGEQEQDAHQHDAVRERERRVDRVGRVGEDRRGAAGHAPDPQPREKLGDDREQSDQAQASHVAASDGALFADGTAHGVDDEQHEDDDRQVDERTGEGQRVDPFRAADDVEGEAGEGGIARGGFADREGHAGRLDRDAAQRIGRGEGDGTVVAERNVEEHVDRTRMVGTELAEHRIAHFAAGAPSVAERGNHLVGQCDEQHGEESHVDGEQALQVDFLVLHA